jgi:hypothetical protein
MPWLVLFGYDADHTYGHEVVLLVDDKTFFTLRQWDKYPSLNLAYGHGNDDIDVEPNIESFMRISEPSYQELKDGINQGLASQYLDKIEDVVTFLDENPSFSSGGYLAKGWNRGENYLFVGSEPTEQELETLRGVGNQISSQVSYVPPVKMPYFFEQARRVFSKIPGTGAWGFYREPRIFDSRLFRNGAIYAHQDDPEDGEVYMLMYNVPEEEVAQAMEVVRQDDQIPERLSEQQAIQEFTRWPDSFYVYGRVPNSFELLDYDQVRKELGKERTRTNPLTVIDRYALPPGLSSFGGMQLTGPPQASFNFAPHHAV